MPPMVASASETTSLRACMAVVRQTATPQKPVHPLGSAAMQTSFTAEQLKDPVIASANGILRKCVHCGFCTATCPTYTLLGDELDSPRGRIYLIKGMLERGEPPTKETVKHVDRCLSCLSCMTTCPSGVHYMHLVDDARAHIEKHLPVGLKLQRGKDMALLALQGPKAEAVLAKLAPSISNLAFMHYAPIDIVMGCRRNGRLAEPTASRPGNRP